MKRLPSIFSGIARIGGTGMAALLLASTMAVGGETVIGGPIGISDPIIVGPIIPIDPLPPTTGNFISLNEALAFSAPVADSTENAHRATTTGSVNGGTIMMVGIPSASGSLNAWNVGGTISGDIAIYTHNLPADTYTISTTKISDGSSVTLGTLTITAFPPPGGVMPFSNTATSAHSNAIVVGPIGPIHIFPFPNWGSIVFGNFGTPLPSGFDLFDVASVTITNSSGVAVLTSSASPIENGSYRATSAVTPGPDAATAKGYGQLNVTETNGKTKGILWLRVSGAPASTTYTYAINGTDVGTVTTSPKGRLNVYKTTGQKKSPLSDPLEVTSISVHDDSGNVVVSASF